tara:strand:+ start:500 stop:778 length:279 start_codon:yes stop_codon:yes gene_type:complete
VLFVSPLLCFARFVTGGVACRAADRFTGEQVGLFAQVETAVCLDKSGGGINMATHGGSWADMLLVNRAVKAQRLSANGLIFGNGWYTSKAQR